MLAPGFEVALARELKLPPEDVGQRIQRDLLWAQRAREAAGKRHPEVGDVRAAARYYAACFRAADRPAR